MLFLHSISNRTQLTTHPCCPFCVQPFSICAAAVFRFTIFLFFCFCLCTRTLSTFCWLPTKCYSQCELQHLGHHTVQKTKTNQVHTFTFQTIGWNFNLCISHFEGEKTRQKKKNTVKNRMQICFGCSNSFPKSKYALNNVSFIAFFLLLLLLSFVFGFLSFWPMWARICIIDVYVRAHCCWMAVILLVSDSNAGPIKRQPTPKPIAKSLKER